MRKIGGWVGAAGTVLVIGGCGETPRPPSAVTDSLGVAIVRNEPASVAAAPVWTLSEKPVTEIGGGADPAVPLTRVTAVAPLGEGQVAIGAEAPAQVLVLNQDGSLLGTLGRQGDGPGEFWGVGSVVPLSGDSVAVWDPDRRRISVFDFGGGFHREMDLSEIAPPSARAAPSTEWVSGFTHLLAFDSESFVLYGEGMISPQPDPGVIRPELSALRISVTGEQLSNFGLFPGMTISVGGPAGPLPIPFGARLYATTTGQHFVAGTAQASEFRVYDRGGALVRIVRWPETDRTITGPFLARWREMVDSQPQIQGLLESVPRADRFPAYEGLVSTDRGEVLVGSYPGPLGIWPMRRADHGPEALDPQIRMPARKWMLFGPDGILRGLIETPRGFEPYSVRDGLVWGVYVDEMDVESVRAYEVIEPD